MSTEIGLPSRRLPGDRDALQLLPPATGAQAKRTGAASPDWLSVGFGALTLLTGGAIAFLISGLSGSVVFLLIGVAGLLVALGTFARAEWGLLALVFMIYTNLSDVAKKFHGAPSIAQPFVALLLVVIFVRWFLSGQRPSGWARPALLLGSYGLVGLASLFYAVNAARVLAAFDDYVRDALMALIVILLLQRAATLRRVVWVLLVAGIFMGSLSVYQQLTGTFSNNYGGFARFSALNVGAATERRISGPIGDPNFYAQILVVLVPLALDRLWSEPKRWLRLGAAWALTVSVLSIFFTYSRGGFLALVIVLALMWARWRPGLLPLLFTTALAILLLQWAPSNYIERIKTIPESLVLIGGDAGTDRSIRGRASENSAAWMMFMDHPLTGIGLNNYPVYYLDYSRLLGMDPRREDRAAHSLYLQIAAETGLVGLSLFSLIVGVMFHGLRRAQKTFAAAGMPDYAGLATAVSISLVGYLVAAIFLHGAYARFFWMLAGLAFAIPLVAQRELAARRGAALE